MEISDILQRTTESQAEANTRLPQQTLGQAEFLELLTVQLTNQNPLEPMDDTDFIAQMANFTSLEQMKDLTASFDQQYASTFLGKEVQVSGPDEQGNQTTRTGVVDEVIHDGSDTFIVVDGIRFLAADVSHVRNPLVNTNP